MFYLREWLERDLEESKVTAEGWRRRTLEAEAERDRLSRIVDSLAAALSSHCGLPAEVLINVHSPGFKITPPNSSPASES